MGQMINKVYGMVQIIETNDYNLFSYFSHNRYCGAKSQELLMEEQKKQFEVRVRKMMQILGVEGFNPNLPVICCFINGVLYIMDGQTRSEACRRLGIPFYYMVMANITDEVEAYKYFFNLNNTGSKWTATDKTISNMFNPTFSEEIRKEQELIVKCAVRWGLPISTVKYIAHGQDSNKQRAMTEFEKMKFSEDTDEILELAQNIASRSDVGIALFKHDKFIRSVARMYRNKYYDFKHTEKLLKSTFKFGGRKSKDVEYLNIFETVLNKGKHNYKIHLVNISGTLR